ncbi:trypsin-like peptidase domain-containing protein [Comamonas odontotermitis]|uniref:trypsin-like peptidase domain-containing protein n=2 Tax=Comamonas odontotermitis TaxID=379895 RepID=UPI001CC6EA8F|nr:trypsin-like peptidase domain-containing protein [Comamonas odontotermitis]UBB19402.1 trypsin-like peptidase domain-containing protein [Comamonas odontotermitis]
MMSFCAVFLGLRRGALLAALCWLGVVASSAQAGVQVDALRMEPQEGTGVLRHATALVASRVAQVEMPPWDAAKAELLQADGARQIGVGRPLASLQTPDQTRNLLAWNRLPNGGRAAALQWAPDGAYGLRLGVVFTALPEAAVFRMYASPQSPASYEVTGAALLERLPLDPATGARTWWTPDLGPTSVLEILLPATVDDAQLALAVPWVSQVVEPPTPLAPAQAEPAKRLSNNCQQDVNCQAALLDQRDAVIRMVYVNGTNTFQCTGTLVNNLKQDQTPYVLTAAHCARDQAMASTLQTMWFYYSQSCNSENLAASHTERYGGARWLATSYGNDMTLLQLNEAPPAGALFAGWDALALPMATAAAGLHHPHGDMQMITKGRIQELASCYLDYTVSRPSLSCTPGAAVDGGFYRVAVDSGGIEGGSSGSALFVDGRVVGTLTGGDNWCPANGVVYGRLDQAVASTFSPWLGTSAALHSSMAAPVYRFHIPRSGADFYTISAEERDAVIAGLPDALHYTGIAFYASAQQRPRMLAVYRYFNPEVVAHFYTTSEAERQFVRQYHPSWQEDGIAWWVPEQGGDGAVPVYRSYQYSTGAHHYALDPAMRDAWLGNPDLLYDGLAYYVWAAP